MQTNQIIEHRQAAKIFFDKDIYENDIEKKMAHDLEQPFASILDRKIINCDKVRLTRKELYLIKQFLLLDSVRTYTPEHFQRVISNFHSNTQRYLKLNGDFFGDRVKSLPITESLKLSAYDLHMRAMKLYLECSTLEQMINHPLATQELYCWAKVVFDAYLSFWDRLDLESERNRLMELSKKELLVEMIIKLELISKKCDEIGRKIVIWSN